MRRAALTLAMASLLVWTSAEATIASASAKPAEGRIPRRPNIVFILADDLSSNLVNEQFTPHVMRLARRGVTFDHYFVTDSLCCPSRASILTGLFPHDTKVATNLPPDGGFQEFQSQHLDARTFAIALQSSGYATSMLGKYLNGYGDPMDAANGPVPPGWTDWHVSNSTGYAEFNYVLNDNGTVNTYEGPDYYGVDVVNEKAQAFIRQHAAKPFAIEIATFAPHQPYTPAPRNANDFPGLTEPRDRSFNTNNVNPPSWLGERASLGPRALAHIDESYRKRAQAMEAVDKLLADTLATLAAEHLTDNTYVVFSSDNGYHLGQHRLIQGKKTAFDTDIRVPLVVAGPGVRHGHVASQVAQNVDLYPTFLELAGRRPKPGVEGRSLAPLLRTGTPKPRWRTVGLVEHEKTVRNPGDPDFEGGGSDPTSYDAIRISTNHLSGFRGLVEAVYVEYDNPQQEIEYYDIDKDPYEVSNLAPRLTTAQRATLHRTLVALRRCHDGRECWRAGKPS